MQIQICMNPPVVSQINIVIFIHGKRTVYQRGMLWKNLHAYAVAAQVGHHAHIYSLFFTGIQVLNQQLGTVVSHISLQRHIKRLLSRFGSVHHSAQHIYAIQVLLYIQIDGIQSQAVCTQSI